MLQSHYIHIPESFNLTNSYQCLLTLWYHNVPIDKENIFTPIKQSCRFSSDADHLPSITKPCVQFPAWKVKENGAIYMSQWDKVLTGKTEYLS